MFLCKKLLEQDDESDGYESNKESYKQITVKI